MSDPTEIIQEYDSQEKAKREAKERDGFACQFCGVTREQHREEFDEDVHAHHIVRSSSGGCDHPRNLITVCRDCHHILERTQAKALDRIRNSSAVSEDELADLREENERLRERATTDEVSELRAENERLRKRVEGLAETAHKLERILRDRELFASSLKGRSVGGEVVVPNVGTRSVVTSDTDEAVDAYREWGSKIERVSMKIEDSDRLAEIILERIEQKRRLGYL